MTHIFREAAKSPGGYITVDFLRGKLAAGRASASLTKAVSLYREALEDMCAKHGGSVRSFRELTVRYSTSGLLWTAVVIIEDVKGRRSTDEYMDLSLRHIKVQDSAGRVRTLRKPKRG